MATLGKMASSLRSWMPLANTTLVKVEASTASSGVQADEERKEFPVMLRVTTEGSKPGRHVGVDIVAVLDISGSMTGDKLDHMKAGMNKVIKKLGPHDRLSIVSFESDVDRLTELTYMSTQGQNDANNKIRDLFTKGGTNMALGLQEGAEILRGRSAVEKSSRIGCILFLSDGMDSSIYTATISPEFPAHTFGLGADHDPVALKHIADKTSGTYSYVNKDTKIIEDAFAVFIAGVTTVVATSAEITLHTHDNVSIAGIESGGYPKKVNPDGKQASISVHNLYAGDRKSFVVYLKLPRRDTDGKQKVLSVGGQYESLGASKKQIAGTDVSVLRPLFKSPGGTDYTGMVNRANDDVFKEVARSKLLEQLKKLVEQATVNYKVNTQNNNNKLLNGSSLDQALQLAKNSVKVFVVNGAESEGWWTELAKEVQVMQSQAEAALPFYVLSWLSSQNMQRATTKDTVPDTAAAFLTKVQQQAIDDAKAAKAAPPKDDARWKKLVARAKSNPLSFLLPSVAGTLVVAWLLVAMAYAMLEARSSSQAAATLRLGPLQYPMLSESEGNYGAWAIKMEAYLRAQGVWDAVAAKDPKEVSPRKDQLALAAIYQAIPEGKLFLLSQQQQKTAKSAWEALRTMHIGDQRLRDAKLQTLRLQFEGLRMKETESVEDFAARLTTIVNKIQAVGEHIPEPYVVKKFLRAVPTKYLQVASAIEQFSDLDIMTLQELLGRLKAHEERLGLLKGAEKENELMTRAEWKAREEAEESQDAFSRLLVSASRSVAQRILGVRTSDGGSSASVHHTPVVSASAAAKILDILVASVIRTKEKEVKAILVEALRDD